MMRDTQLDATDVIPSTMDRHELAGLIREEGIWTVVELFITPEAQVMMGFRDGINIAGWEARAGPGVIRFCRKVTPDDGPPDEAVIYINSDNHPIIASIMADVSYPAIVIGKTEARRDDVDPMIEAAHRARVAHLLPDAQR